MGEMDKRMVEERIVEKNLLEAKNL